MSQLSFCGYVSSAQVTKSDTACLWLRLSLLMLLRVSSGTHLASVKLRACKGSLRKLNVLLRWKMKPSCTAETDKCRNFLECFCSLKWESQLRILGLGRQSCLFELFVLKSFMTFGQSFWILTLEMHLVSTLHSVSAMRKILDIIMQ